MTEFNLATCDVPGNGTCTVSPTVGDVWTRFKVVCENWLNSDPPTNYEFRVDDGWNDTNYVYHKKSSIRKTTMNIKC